MSQPDYETASATPGLALEQVLIAAVIYVLLVFLVGFVLGTIRVLLLLPMIGQLAATLVELPMILALSWFVCAWTCQELRVSRRLPARLGMGAMAFAFLMILEIGIGILMFGRTPQEQFLAYRQLHASLGLAAQVAFALFPAAQLLLPDRE